MSAVLDRSRLLVLEISGSNFSKGDAEITRMGDNLRPIKDPHGIEKLIVMRPKAL